MNIVLWVLQILLTLAFLASGLRKFIRNDDQIRALPWTKGMTPDQVRGIGVLEVLAGLGLVLPWATNILPWLTPLAAVGVILLMLGAAYANYRANLTRPIVANAILLIMAVVVVVGRWVLVA